MTTASTEQLREADAPAPPVKKSRARPYVILGIVVMIAAAAYLGFTWFSSNRESTDDAQVEGDVVPLSSRVSGLVLHVLVTDNQSVKKGDLLVEIDPTDLKAKVAQSEADVAAARAQASAADAQVAIVEATSKGGLSTARAQLYGSTTGVESAGAQVDSAKAAVERAQAEATRADTDLQRAESLRKDSAIPQAQLDTARANAEAAHAAVAQARAQFAMAEDMKRTAFTRIAEARGRVEQSAPIDAQLAAARANADLAHARVSSAEAGLEQTKLQLSYTRIEAPTDGLLSKLAVREGQLLQSGQQVVAVVPNATYVVANFKETQVGELRSGQRVVVHVDAFPGRVFEGTLQSVSPATGARFSLLPADNASGNFVKVVQRVPVKIAWTGLPGDVHLAAGMSADVTVHTR